MGNNKKDHITISNYRREGAYKDNSLIEKRRALYEFTSPRHIIEEEVLGLLELKGNESLLDIGCAEGKLLLKTIERYPNVKCTGVDIAAGMINAAEQEARRRKLPISFRVEDAQQLSYPDETFNRVTALHMIYHVQDIEKAISEMARVLIPGGRLVLTANSVKSKEMLRVLKLEVADQMGFTNYPDPNLRFNIGKRGKLLERYFSRVELFPYESKLILKNTQPYVNYFDSTREFWDPPPSDQKWSKVLNLVHNRIQFLIDQKGLFEEINLFGAFLAYR